MPRLHAYLRAMETKQKQRYLKLNTQMFVRMCGVWFAGFVEIMFMLCLAKSRKLSF